MKCLDSYFRPFLAVLALLSVSGAYADDIPLPPKTFKVADQTDRFIFSWSKAESKGENGQPVNTSGVKYILEELNGSYEPVRVLAKTSDLMYVHPYSTRMGTQDLKRFGLRVSNDAGSSDYVFVRTVIGAPYNLPFHESFALGSSRSMCWQEGDGIFASTTGDASDGDYGCMMCHVSDSDAPSSFNLGKILLKHSANPRFSFSIKGLEAGEQLKLKFARSDGAEAELKKISGPIDGWQDVVVDLGRLANEDYIIPKFVFSKTSDIVSIDNIRLFDPFESDLGIRILCDDMLSPGSEIRILLTNEGVCESTDAAIEITAEDGETAIVPITEPLQPGETLSITYAIPQTTRETLLVKTKIDWLYDVNPDNDRASKRILISPNPTDQMQSGIAICPESGNRHDAIYSIDGRKVSSDIESLSPGLYIKGGKKIYVK